MSTSSNNVKQVWKWDGNGHKGKGDGGGPILCKSRMWKSSEQVCERVLCNNVVCVWRLVCVCLCVWQCCVYVCDNVVCVCKSCVCVWERRTRSGWRTDGGRDTEQKTRTPHKNVENDPVDVMPLLLSLWARLPDFLCFQCFLKFCLPWFASLLENRWVQLLLRCASRLPKNSRIPFKAASPPSWPYATCNLTAYITPADFFWIRLKNTALFVCKAGQTAVQTSNVGHVPSKLGRTHQGCIISCHRSTAIQRKHHRRILRSLGKLRTPRYADELFKKNLSSKVPVRNPGKWKSEWHPEGTRKESS